MNDKRYTLAIKAKIFLVYLLEVSSEKLTASSRTKRHIEIIVRCDELDICSVTPDETDIFKSLE